ncbi:unnamed protein product [Paramecium sonneborni]|uniref:Uncharacterized protein n=1 Tax=Paramecium sonneborni TaxID=65129 RepID=A0A8S1LI17_9CILI|nr:unnamed protein product [Paramecium sonneborni]
MTEFQQMEIESYILNFKVRHTDIIKQKLQKLHEEESADQLQPFYQTFLKNCRDYLHQKLRQTIKKVLDEDLLELLKVNIFLAELSYTICKEVPELKSYPLTFSEDIYECLSLQELQDYFNNLNSQISTISKFQDENKYVLLRICNSMLKRLSTTQDTFLRGQVQIFLTQIFSTIHPSLRKKPINIRDRGFDEESVKVNASLPYSFYKNFWTLQKYLNNSELIFRSKIELDDIGDEAGQVLQGVSEPQRTKNLQAVIKVIMRALQYFKENPIEPEIITVKRFPKFLTKYSLFKNQLNDPYFRKLFLNQVLLFIFVAELENQEKQFIQNLKIEVQKQLDELGDKLGDKLGEKVQHLIDTERTWRLWVTEKQCFDDGYEKFSIKASEKAKKKRQEIQRRIYDDLKYKQTDAFQQILQDQGRPYKIETNPIEPGLNYYLNEVFYQLDQSRKIADNERCKNLKDYAWKSVRVISKYLLKELKITNLITQDLKPLPNLEDIVENLKNAGNEMIAERLSQPSNNNNINNSVTIKPVHINQQLPIQK